MSDRIEILKNSVNNAIRAICPERAILWTEYYKNKLNRNKPVEIQAAEAMCYVLQETFAQTSDLLSTPISNSTKNWNWC